MREQKYWCKASVYHDMIYDYKIQHILKVFRK